MREWRLRTSLLALLVATTLITFTIIGGIVLLVRLPMVDRETLLEMQRLAVSQGRVIEQGVDSLEIRLRTTARLVEGREIKRQSLLDAMVAEGGFSAVYVLDRDGRVTALAFADKAGASRDSLLVGMDLSGAALFQNVRRSSRPVWSDRYLSVLRAEPVVGVAVPLSDGALIAELNSAELDGVLQASMAQTNGIVVVTDSYGDWVAGQGLAPEARHRNWGNEIARLRGVEGTPRAYISLDGRDHYAGIAASQKLGWSFVVATPSGWGNQRYRTTILLVLGGFAGSMVFGLLIAPWWARLIARPLNDIISRTQALANGGRKGPPSNPSRVAELNRLSRDLEHMADSLLQREAAVALSEERLRTTIETTPSVAIQWYDRNGRVMYWNSASRSFYGYTQEEALGKGIDELIVGPDLGDRFRDFLAQIEASGEVVGPMEIPCRKKDGSSIDVMCTIFSIPDAVHGRLFACMDVDLTAVKQAEVALRQLNSELEDRIVERTRDLKHTNDELQQAMHNLQMAQSQLVQAEKLAALGELVAGVAHELNTPIGNGLMAISALREQSQAFRGEMEAGLKRSTLQAFIENVASATEIAERNLQRAGDLVMSFKQVAVDQTSSQRRDFALREVVDEIVMTVQPMFRRSAYTVAVDVPATGLDFDSYPGPLGQVLTNLISNALKHGFEGRETGCIRIAATSKDAGNVRLQVEDDGVGIPPDFLPRIFDPFVTSRLGSGGSGLGLHIVYNMVTGILGGKISVESTENQGTRFTMTLPLVAPEPQA